jgi:hypothetical protein
MSCGQITKPASLVSLPALLMAYFGARIGRIGVDAAGRTRENLAGAPPKAVVKRK